MWYEDISGFHWWPRHRCCWYLVLPAFFIKKCCRLKKERCGLSAAIWELQIAGHEHLVLGEEGSNVFLPQWKILRNTAVWGYLLLQLLHLRGQTCSERNKRPIDAYREMNQQSMKSPVGRAGRLQCSSRLPRVLLGSSCRCGWASGSN